jgi:putative hydrolase of the HAD superfamily
MCRQLAELGGVRFEVVKQWIFGEGNLLRRIEVGEFSQEDCYQQFRAVTESDVSLQDFLYAAAAIFSLKLDMIPVVTQLVAVRQPIGILSNTCQPHWDYVSCGRYGMIPDLFDVIVLSHEVHSAKPDRAIYDTAAEMAGRDPCDILFVDDRPENVAGALAAGFEAFPFTNARDFVVDLRERGFRFNL